MNDNEEYLLFLRESLTDPRVYIIKGVFYGKVPLRELEAIQFKGDAEKIQRLQDIFKEARNKYK
jgi:hypothetical protein